MSQEQANTLKRTITIDIDVSDDDVPQTPTQVKKPRVCPPAPTTTRTKEEDQSIDINELEWSTEEEDTQPLLAIQPLESTLPEGLVIVPTIAMGNIVEQVNRVYVNETLANAPPAPEEKKGRGKRVKRWVITYNNPSCTSEEFETFLTSKEEIKGFVFQKEKGEQGTEHFQGYIELHKEQYTTGIHSILEPHKMSVMYANGSKKANKAYCTKEEGRIDGPYLYGTLLEEKNGSQGKRTDLEKLWEAIKENNNEINDDIIDEHLHTYSKYKNGVNGVINELRVRRQRKAELKYWKRQCELEDQGLPIEGQQQRELTLLFGPTGVGKTTKAKMIAARKCSEDESFMLYEKNGDHQWWDGYESGSTILWDEFKGQHIGIETFNMITNKGAQQLEVKGGMIMLDSEHMYFTSNRHPSQWWKNGKDSQGETKYSNWCDPRFQAVARRFKKVYWWNDQKELKILTNPSEYTDADEKQQAENAWLLFWKWKETNSNLEGYFSL